MQSQTSSQPVSDPSPALLTLVLVALTASSAAVERDGVTTWPLPPGLPTSATYVVTVNGVEVPVLRYEGSAPGAVAIARFACAGRATVAVRRSGGALIPAGAVVSPRSYAIQPSRSGDRLEFDLDRPRTVIVHYGGWRGFLGAEGIDEVLILAALPVETEPTPGPTVIDAGDYGSGIPGTFATVALQSAIDDAAASSTAKTVLIRSGTWDIDAPLNMRSGVTVHVAAAACVRITSQNIPARGMFSFREVANAHLGGRGLLHVNGSVHRPIHGFSTAQHVWTERANDCSVSGLTLLDAGNINVWVTQSDRFTARDLAIVAAQDFLNTDGIDYNDACADGLFDNVFCYNTDDALAPGFTQSMGRHVSRNIVAWCEGSAIKQSTSPDAPVGTTFADFSYENIDVIGCQQPIFFFPRGGTVRDYLIKNVRVEGWAVNGLIMTTNASGAVINGVSILGYAMPSAPLTDVPAEFKPSEWQDGIRLWGYDATSPVGKVAFAGWTIGDVAIDSRAILEETVKVDSRSWANVANITFSGDRPTVIGVRATTRYARETGGPLVFEFERSGPPAASLQIAYRLGGTATAGADYAAPSGTVTFSAGAAIATLVLAPIADGIVEGIEQILIDVHNESFNTTYMLGPDYRHAGEIDDAGH